METRLTDHQTAMQKISAKSKYSSRSNRPNSDFTQKSSLYQEFLAEREEILRHKWLESEKAGRDIGFERALLDWIRKHRDDWRTSRRVPEPSEKTE